MVSSKPFQPIMVNSVDAPPVRAKQRKFAEKRAWTKAEDEHLKKLVEQCGGPSMNLSWSTISQRFSDSFSVQRSGKQCRERYANHLHPNVRKGGWTPEEDDKIRKLQAELGNQWAKMVKFLPGRSDNSIKNRFWSFERSKARKGTPAVSPASSRPTTPRQKRKISDVTDEEIMALTSFRRPNLIDTSRNTSPVIYSSTYKPQASPYPPAGPVFNTVIPPSSTTSPVSFHVPKAPQVTPNAAAVTRPPVSRAIVGDQSARFARPSAPVPAPAAPFFEAVTYIPPSELEMAEVLFNWPRAHANMNKRTRS